MFNPIKLKFKKEYKDTIKNKEYSINKSSLFCGNFGKASAKGFLFYKEIVFVKKAIAKEIKGVVFSRVRPNKTKTEKKKGMRMGKGKETVGSYAAKIFCNPAWRRVEKSSLLFVID
jgi:ribosomal protein L16/L10AE